MPALRRYNPSVAPVDICGTITAPGQYFAAVFVIAPITSARSGDTGLETAGRVTRTWIAVSATMRRSCAVALSGGYPGSNRQFTVARATCGNALSAWPANSRVATQVVRSTAFYTGTTDNRVA